MFRQEMVRLALDGHPTSTVALAPLTRLGFPLFMDPLVTGAALYRRHAY